MDSNRETNPVIALFFSPIPLTYITTFAYQEQYQMLTFGRIILIENQKKKKKTHPKTNAMLKTEFKYR